MAFNQGSSSYYAGVPPPPPLPTTAPVEYSTLIYTLHEGAPITFDNFYLIIRSLHGFKVDAITPSPETSTITVSVFFYANVQNARKKLGGLSEFIDVSRISEQIKPHELSDLAKLRALYKFGSGADEEESSSSKQNKKRKYKN